jgi:hypothetical protein
MSSKKEAAVMPSDDLRTLQLGPLWVLSALLGRHSGFAAPDLAAFWDALVSVSLRSPAPTRELLTSVAAHRDSLLLDYELDGRSVVSGLHDVVAALGPGPSERVEGYKRALVHIGAAVGRARGPYGQQISTEDLNRLLLAAQLLDYSPAAADAA